MYIQLLRMNSPSRKGVIRLPCACANLRRAARIVTQLYDAALHPTGLHVTQFTLLQALNHVEEISQKQLAELLEIDSTTLTRTLAPLRTKGWLQSLAAQDRRELRISLTAEGKQEYERALPYWRSAQETLKQALGKKAWNRLSDATVKTAEIMIKPR
jgi:DNA-binding MarR family transcriptional regulator